MGHVKTHNITLILDQPSVGQGMSDNPMNAIFVPSPSPVEVSLIQVVGITPNGSYIEAASGENFAGSSSQRDFGMFSPKVCFLCLFFSLMLASLLITFYYYIIIVICELNLGFWSFILMKVRYIVYH